MRDTNSDIQLVGLPKANGHAVNDQALTRGNSPESKICSSHPQTSISIIIADSMAITSELLTQAFSKQPGFEILGCPRNPPALVDLISARGPDIALIKSSDKKGMFAPLVILDTIHGLSPSTRSIVLSSEITREDVVAYFHAQARGILSADLTDFATLCQCINSVYQGQIWASSNHLNYLIESLSGSKPLQIFNSDGEMVLSTREQEVLRLLAEGRSNRAMAAALNLSEHTIKNHLFHIFYKLGVSSRTEAILYAMKGKVIPAQKNAG
jgi:DNA-binding NarL/FixJ family response regulator